ncbi:MAG TPA: dihydrofolate reductase family protein [Dehalococcoidia bacterium]|nr:dihydrofolate reductase family protein [Dehalococcoidia bacterium]
MGRIVVTEFVSLDGVMEDPGGSEGTEHGGWSMAYWHDEIARVKFDELFASDAQLLGRVTYQGVAAAWPAMHDEFADRMNGMPKYVVSKTLSDLSWNNSHLLNGDLAADVTSLKQQAGRDILVAGSRSLVQGLRQHGLVDLYRLLVYPVVLGSGKRIFEDGGRSNLKLVTARPVGPQVVLMEYEAVRER